MLTDAHDELFAHVVLVIGVGESCKTAVIGGSKHLTPSHKAGIPRAADRNLDTQIARSQLGDFTGLGGPGSLNCGLGPKQLEVRSWINTPLVVLQLHPNYIRHWG